MRSILLFLLTLVCLALGGCGYLVPHHHQTAALSALPEGVYPLV